MWQHVKFSEQIRSWDTLACCWDVKQPTNQPTNNQRPLFGKKQLQIIIAKQENRLNDYCQARNSFERKLLNRKQLQWLMLNMKQPQRSFVRQGKLQEVSMVIVTLWCLLPLAAILSPLPASSAGPTSLLPGVYCHFSILLSKHTCSCKSMGKFVMWVWAILLVCW